MVYASILWYIMVYHGILWYLIIIYYGILWHNIVYYTILGYIIVYYVILCHNNDGRKEASKTLTFQLGSRCLPLREKAIFRSYHVIIQHEAEVEKRR